MKSGALLVLLIGLLAAKTISDKRLEFFREAASGYNVDAYYLAINVITTIEHSAQVVVAAFFGHWLRNSLAAALPFYVNFLTLCWMCVSWALLLAVVLPPATVVVGVGFFMAVTALCFSGGLAPTEYRTM